MPKYHSISTLPAKVFFEILETKNYQLLRPKPKEKGLEGVFIAIYDDFFLKSDNAEGKEYLRLIEEISTLEYKIKYLKTALHFYLYNKTTKDMRMDFIDAVKTGYDIVIDPEADFIDEVQRLLTIEIGIINNDLSYAKMAFEGMTNKSKEKIFDYEKKIVAIENVLKRSIADYIMLDKYIAYEQSAAETISAQRNKKAA